MLKNKGSVFFVITGLTRNPTFQGCRLTPSSRHARENGHPEVLLNFGSRIESGMTDELLHSFIDTDFAGMTKNRGLKRQTKE
jgi:hypothetical protein